MIFKILDEIFVIFQVFFYYMYEIFWSCLPLDNT